MCEIVTSQRDRTKYSELQIFDLAESALHSDENFCWDPRRWKDFF